MEAGWFILDKRRIIFLDRDGVINERAQPHHYIVEWKDFKILPKVCEAIRRCKEAGYYVVIVSNQRGIARGICSREQVDRLHRRMLEELKKRGAAIDKIYLCPHEEGECDCRKPAIGLLHMAEAQLWEERKERADKEHSWMIGDSVSDVEAGRAYGVKTIWIRGEKEGLRANADYSVGSLYEAAELLLAAEGTGK